MSAATAALLLAAAVIAGCGSGGRTVSDEPPIVTLEGRVHGFLVDGWAGCVALENAAGERFDVTLLDGWTYEAEPLVARDPAGVVRVREGDLVRLTGSFAELGESICNVGLLFSTQTIEVVAEASQ
jgi:hypothetical protein